MNGLEALLFAIFIVFVLINLLIRFFVKKARRSAESVSVPSDRGEEEGISADQASLQPLELEEEVPWEKPWMKPPEEQALQIGKELKAQAPEEPEYQKEPFIEERFPREQVSKELPSQEQKQEAVSAYTRGELTRLKSGVERNTEWLKKTKLEKLDVTLEFKPAVEEKAVSFWERIERLTPLQRAIVLSEVLGPPKGLQ